MFSFLYPLYFLFLIPLIIFTIYLYKKWWKKINFWPINDLKKIFKHNTFYIKMYYVLVWFIFVFYIFIFSKPVITNSLQEQSKNWIDIQIVLDVSFSMKAEDLSPNRLDVAKEVISAFLSEIYSDRVWIIIFAWKTFTSLPLSFDYEIIKDVVKNIWVNTINQMYSHMQWTAVWDALILAADSFNNNTREKIIILLTDWEANRGLDPLVSLKYIKEKNTNIKIYTIWIWWDKPTFVTIKDNFWRYTKLPVGWIDEDTLKIIAKETWWKYFRANSKKAFKDIFDEISKLEKSELKIEQVKINKEQSLYFVYFLIIIYILFLYLKFRKSFF